MTSYYVEFFFDFGYPFDEATEAHFDEVAEALAQLDGVDGDVGLDIEAGRVELCLTVEAKDRPEALVAAFTAARTAVHTAGGATRGWENMLNRLLDTDNYRSSISPSSLARGNTCSA